MLAFYLYKYFLEEIWWYKEENFCEFLVKCLGSIFCIVPCFALLIFDIIILPIEILILIIFMIKNKNKDNKKK